ncbi:hypothetical protein DSO57_1023054 [Entomophthora muscae]|uniref:Uncharacterized protein n=1 Tax=Entomophthora muscae TaxID=34485 RepID=A0ACC2S5F8_9FUNG|nr:hypothetical protein DSO57_1023054 [Entomophthora muscae]
MSQSTASEVPPYVSLASVKTLLHGFGSSEFKATAGGVAVMNWFLDEFLQLITTSACDNGLDAKHISANIERLFPSSNFARSLVEYAGYSPKPVRFGIGSGIDGERRRGIYSPRTVFESLRAMTLHCGALGKRTDLWQVTQLARDLIPSTTALFTSRVLEHLAHCIVISAVLQQQQLIRSHQELTKANLVSAPAPEMCLDYASVMLALASDPQLAEMSARIGFRDLVERTHCRSKPCRQAKSTFHQLSKIDALAEPKPPEPTFSQRILTKLRFLKPRPPELPLDEEGSIYEDSAWTDNSACLNPTKTEFDKVIISSNTQHITLTPSVLRS